MTKTVDFAKLRNVIEMAPPSDKMYFMATTADNQTVLIADERNRATNPRSQQALSALEWWLPGALQDEQRNLSGMTVSTAQFHMRLERAEGELRVIFAAPRPEDLIAMRDDLIFRPH